MPRPARTKKPESLSFVLASLLLTSGTDYSDIARLAGIAPEAVNGWASNRAKGGAALLLRWQRIVEAMGGAIIWQNFHRVLAPEGGKAPSIALKRTTRIKATTLHEAAIQLWAWRKKKPGLDDIARATGENVGAVRSILQHRHTPKGSPDGQLEPIHRLLSALCIGVSIHIGEDLLIKLAAYPLRAAPRERKVHRPRRVKPRKRTSAKPRAPLDPMRVADAEKAGLSVDEIARAFEYSSQRIREVLLVAKKQKSRRSP